MIALIYIKWWYPVDSYLDATKFPDVISADKGTQPNIATSPSIITLVIGDVMGLTGFAKTNNQMYLFFDKQQLISDILVYSTFISLPLMLCCIPCIHICCHRKHKK